jgi:small subunit ribosomal protein S11
LAKQEVQKAVVKKPMTKAKKKTMRAVPSGVAHVKAAFAATVAAQDAAKIAMTQGMKEVEVNLNGPGAGRESAVRGLQSAGLMISIIRDKTPVPHNGCRPRKRRRV